MTSITPSASPAAFADRRWSGLSGTDRAAVLLKAAEGIRACRRTGAARDTESAVRAGGRSAFVAAADVVVAAEDATFALTEVKLGLAPAAISLTVLPRMTSRAAALTALSGEVFSGAQAASYGLVTTAVPASELDAELDRVLASLVTGAPQGLRETKALLTRELGRAPRRPGTRGGRAQRPAVRLGGGAGGDDRVPGPASADAVRGNRAGIPRARLELLPCRAPSGAGDETGRTFGAEGIAALTDEAVETRGDRPGAGVRRPGVPPAPGLRGGRAAAGRVRATSAGGWVTRVAWSSGTRWSSRPRSGSPSSTPPTRGWSSVASTCAR